MADTMFSDIFRRSGQTQHKYVKPKIVIIVFQYGIIVFRLFACIEFVKLRKALDTTINVCNNVYM